MRKLEILLQYSANVLVRFKKSVLEPQGKAIHLSLKDNHFEGIESIRVGKIVEITLEAANKEAAMEYLKKITEEVLYNPVMETAEIILTEEKA